ncbi:hypothetical protein AcV7_000246 [Taiwanofungus camphoratus]|nr:hypothetical protein AcV7_000246 [Antrodia cinnamomea]
MHFGPEWMRTKGSTRPAPSPPLTTSSAPPGASSYSALVTPVLNTTPERRDVAHPFRYSREEMLRIYREGGGRGGLGLEVERWEGIVREVGCDPIGLKEMSETEKKIFAGPLNSEIRRRQSTDVLSPLATSSLGERPKLNHAASGTASPMRERIGNVMGRRRDSSDQLPRKLSLSSMQGPLGSPRETALPSPRTRIGHAPGFDGVLSESWSSRRRGTENGPKGVGTPSLRNNKDGSQNDRKGLDIKEENEDDLHSSGQPSSSHEKLSSEVTTDSQSDPPLDGIPNDPPQKVAKDSNDPSGSTANSAVGSQDNANSLPVVGSNGDSMVSGPPPGLTDPASIEWSYLDPQGQVQGPFRADIMQRWHDEGYFSADLLMKRTHLDSEWTSVGEMLHRAGGHPIFLTPGITSTAPPGLPRRPDPLLEGAISDRDRSSPYQSVPTSSLRSNTLDPYLHNGTSTSNSPTSSFGAARFANGSPDPGPFEGKLSHHLYSDPSVGPRIATFPIGPNSPMTGQRRAALNDSFDPSLGMRPPPLNAVPGRGTPLEGLGFTGLDGVTTSSMDSISPFTPNFGSSGADAASAPTGSLASPVLGTLRGSQSSSMNNGHIGSSTFIQGDFGPIGGFTNPSSASRVINRDGFSKAVLDDRSETHSTLGFGGAYPNGNGSSFSSTSQQLSQNVALQYSSSQDAHLLQSLTPISELQSASHSIPTSQQLHHSFVSSPSYASGQSQWPSQDTSVFRRPGPFDPNYPTANNTVTTGSANLVPPSFGRASSQTILSANQSPWFAASQGVVSDGWASDSNSLTVANLGQHNQQLQHDEVRVQAIGLPIDLTNVTAETTQTTSRDVQPQAPAPIVTPPISSPSNEAHRPSQKLHRKSSAQPVPTAPQPSASKTIPGSPTIVKPPSPIPTVDHRPAWSNDDDDSRKSKPSITVIGLREIQEAETKKLEARKAAERERERAARAAAGTAVQAEDFQPFTASWGLPTSQAGAARTSAAKESPASSPNAPVWTNASKPQVVKKSMKEIQAEEEKRKKMTTKEKETVAAAARRAYSETTNKNTPPVQPLGGAWTTVAAGGKTSAVVATSPRPVVTSSVSNKVIPSTSSTSVASASSVTTRVAPSSVVSPRPSAPPKGTAPKADESPVPPSHDFLKWLSESLKGLKSTVNFEEITSMLLSFPLDPDPSTVEIISDLIYASSTTLDGRRFASEFVSRRRSDIALRSKNGTSATTPGKALSIAEVVKAQPKPTQSEWGGFKVVNKKKKGGRS